MEYIKEDYKKVADLIASYFIDTQESQCLLCVNEAENPIMRSIATHGCEGHCKFGKKYTKEELLNFFIAEVNKQIMK